MKTQKMSLKAARVNVGYSQKEVAAKLGIDRSTLRCWENGNSEPKVSQAMYLCCLYQTSIDNINFLNVSSL